MNLKIVFLGIYFLNTSFAQAQNRGDSATLVIRDQSRYSKAFLARMKTFSYSSHYELRDSMLIIGQLDTAWFPTDMPLNNNLVFSGIKDDRQYELLVRRVNYTTLSFTFRVYQSWKLSTEHRGLADLAPSFFLGAETDEDDRTGTTYLSTEYYARINNCDLALRIGINDQSQLCARVKASCADAAKNIALSDCPTLYSK